MYALALPFATQLPVPWAIALPLAGAAVGAVLGQILAYRNTSKLKRRDETQEAKAAARLVDAELGLMERDVANALDRYETTADEPGTSNLEPDPLAEMPKLPDSAWQQARLILARLLSLQEWDVGKLVRMERSEHTDEPSGVPVELCLFVAGETGPSARARRELERLRIELWNALGSTETEFVGSVQ